MIPIAQPVDPMNPTLVPETAVPQARLPRRLAIDLMHRAQIAQPNAIDGFVVARDGLPVAWRDTPPTDAQALWARLWSVPDAPAVPDADELTGAPLHLVISLNTKGVLEMRAWQRVEGTAVEVVLRLDD